MSCTPQVDTFEYYVVKQGAPTPRTLQTRRKSGYTVIIANLRPSERCTHRRACPARLHVRVQGLYSAAGECCAAQRALVTCGCQRVRTRGALHTKRERYAPGKTHQTLIMWSTFLLSTTSR
jgi:hypothetical protein